MIPLSYRTLASNYPNKHDTPTKQLLDEIGGEVRSSLGDAVNTCAIRVSYALNHSGAPITKLGGLYLLQGAAAKGQKLPPAKRRSDLYIVRVLDMKRYLTQVYGLGKRIYDARSIPDKLIGLSGATQGIILFQWNGPVAEFGATGHVDLFQLSASDPKLPLDLIPDCEGACYWQPTVAPMEAFLWQTPP
jgi:hypothetical protein